MPNCSITVSASNGSFWQINSNISGAFSTLVPFGLVTLSSHPSAESGFKPGDTVNAVAVKGVPLDMIVTVESGRAHGRFICSMISSRLMGLYWLNMYDSFILKLIYACAGIIFGRVYHDKNNNTVWDSGEEVFSGAAVMAINPSENNRTLSSTTNSTGMYLFDHLPPSLYRIRFGVVPGLTLPKIPVKKRTAMVTQDSKFDLRILGL